MNNRGIVSLVAVGSVACITIGVLMQFFHKLENQSLAIVQSMDGDVEVRKHAGWWFQICPTITEYPKAGIYICSTQSKERDPFTISFRNKSTATMNAQVGYRIDTASDEKIVALHQAAEGNDEKIWALIVNTINTEAQKVSTTFDPSDVIGGDKFPEFVAALQKSIIHNKELLESGIDVDKFNVSGKPIPDEETRKQFDKQRTADLQKRLAEAEKITLEAEKIKVQAEYAKKMAEQEGIAKAQMAKEVQDAERQKKLAEIEAEKRVAVEKLEKEQVLVKMNKEKEAAEIEIQKQKAVALVEASKIREVAEIEKQTEAARLEKEKLVAEQVKIAALAKKEQIDKSGAITEKERFQLEIGMKTKVGVAEAYGKALSSAKLPQLMVIGGNGQDGKSGTNPFDILLQTMTLEKLNSVQAQPAPAK